MSYNIRMRPEDDTIFIDSTRRGYEYHLNQDHATLWGGVDPTCVEITTLHGGDEGLINVCAAHVEYADGTNDSFVADGEWTFKLGTTVTSFRIIPFFNSNKMQITLNTDTTQYGVGTDEFTMGTLNQPYMCMNVEVKHISYIAQNYGATYPVDLIISPSEPVYVSDGTNIFNIPFPQNYPPEDPSGEIIATITSSFLTCASAGRPIPICSTCPITPSVGNYQFLQLIYNELSFVSSITSLLQSTANVNGVIYTPTRFVTWTDAAFTLFTRSDFGLFSTTSRVYGRLTASLSFADLGSKLELDHCVTVERTNDVTYPYSFIPAICTDIHYPVCVRDLYRYAVKAGTQCDACGPSSRTEIISPGETAFSLFPRASPADDPLGHAILDAYFEGRLEILIDNQEDIPWDAVKAQLGNVSIVFAFEGARDALLDALSNRPRFTSQGQTEEFVYWIDMDFARWFPEDCGLVTNPRTGVQHRRCAISKEHCSTLTDFEGVTMASGDVPQIFTVNMTASHTSVLCTQPILPSRFHEYTSEGGPQPLTTALEVLFNDADSIEFRVINPNATWTNTGRRLIVDLSVPFNLAGVITSSVNVGEYRIWVGSQSPTFDVPLTVEYVTGWIDFSTTSYDVSYIPTFEYLSVLAFEFRFLQEGSRVTLSTVRYSNAETIGACASHPQVNYVELPSYVESKAPYHTCDYTVGQCFCAPDSPYGGPVCEWPTVSTPARGKEVCNRFGDDGGYALSSDDSPVELTASSGVFLDVRGHFECKCVNPGLTILTVMRPASAFDYAFVLRRDKKPNADEFVEVDPPQDIAVPVSHENVKDVCNSQSAALPSWNTGDEVELFTQMLTEGVFVDMEYRPSLGEFWWTEREEQFNSFTDNSTSYSDPCDNAGLCDALNWNNLAYNTTSGIPSITHVSDGFEVPAAVLPPFTVSIPTTTDVVVEMHHVGVFDMLLSADGEACNLRAGANSAYAAWDCLFPLVTNLIFTGGSHDIREIRVFSVTDGGRPVGYMTNF